MAHTLYHFCCSHSRTAIGEAGTLQPSKLTGLLWMTDLDTPIRAGLGLTAHTLDCDRTEHRYRVVHEGADLLEAHIYHWPEIRKGFARGYVDALEGPGALPMHWYISDSPQTAVHDCKCTP